MVARTRAGLLRKAGLNPVPIVVFVLAAALAGGGLFAWDYSWRRKQEEATRPPAPDVLVRNLIENIIGKGTVKEVTLDRDGGAVAVTFESATFKPDQAEKQPAQSREFLSAEATLASDIILSVPAPIAAQVPVMGELRRVTLTIVAQGRTLATAVRERGKELQVTFVDPRLKP